MRYLILFGIVLEQMSGCGSVVPPALNPSLEGLTMDLPDLQMTYRKYRHVYGIHGLKP